MLLSQPQGRCICAACGDPIPAALANAQKNGDGKVRCTRCARAYASRNESRVVVHPRITKEKS